MLVSADTLDRRGKNSANVAPSMYDFEVNPECNKSYNSASPLIDSIPVTVDKFVAYLCFSTFDACSNWLLFCKNCSIIIYVRTAIKLIHDIQAIIKSGFNKKNEILNVPLLMNKQGSSLF